MFEKPLALWRRVTPMAVLIGCLGLTAFFGVALHSTMMARDEARFGRIAQSTGGQIQSRLDAYTAMMRAASGLFAADPDLDRDGFHRFAESVALRDRYPGLRWLGFVKRLAPGEAPRLERRMRADGLEDFRIWPAAGAAAAGAARTAIIYLEPLDTANVGAAGYDMMTDQTRRAAMEKARDTGRPVASGKMTLVQEIDANVEPGFLLFVPVYRGQMPSTIERRREELVGWIYSPFRVGDLFARIFAEGDPEISVELFDGELTEAKRMLASTSGGKRGHYSAVVPLDVGGRTWLARLTSRPGFEIESGWALFPVTLLGGLFASLALYAVTAAQARARARAERAADELRRSEAALTASQARQRRMIDGGIVGMFMGAARGLVSEANDEFLRLSGYSRFDLETRAIDWRRLTEMGSRDRLAIAEVRAHGKNAPYATNLVRRDGSKVPVLIGAIMTPGDDTAVCFVVDLTESRRAELALRRREEELRLVIDSVPVLLAYLDRDGRYILSNHLYMEWFGGGRSMVGESVRQVLGDEAWEQARPAFERALRGEEAHFEFRAQRGALGLRTVSGTYVPRREGDDVVGVVEFLEDVTEEQRATEYRRQLLEATDSARRVAEETNRAKDEFLATLSHELRTPLHAMFGWLQMLRAGRLDEAMGKRALDVLDRNVRAQSQLVEDLLDVSRIIAGKLRLERRAVDVEAVTRAAIDSARPAAEQKNVTVAAEFDGDPGWVDGDSARLQQVLWNLLTNAVRFSHAGGAVVVRLRREGFDVVIEVVDRGKGIAASFLPFVFDRFRQADSTSTRAHGGLGLGLAIVRHIVEMHGGRVAAASDGEGKGATFTVRLPRTAPPPVREGRRPTPSKVESRLNDVTVLVVDDEADARELLRVALESRGARVLLAGSAREALVVLSRSKPDVMVSDVGMPEQDGLWLMRQIRRDLPELARRTPAVALTAYAADDDRQRALAAGFAMHVSKPVEPDRLAGIVASLAQ